MTGLVDNELVIKAFQAAKERLFDKGWTTRTAGLRDGPNCMIGALYFGIGDLNLYGYRFEPYEDELDGRAALLWSVSYEYLRSVVGGEGPIPFNDHPDTTLDSVLEVFDLAIKRLESE